MISQRKLISEYNKLAAKYKDAPLEEGQIINIYTCTGGDKEVRCNNIVKTKDLVAGTTPLVVNCVKCGGTMKSNMYSNIPKEPEVTMEWYRPEQRDVLKWRKRPGLIDHILQGGLMLRPMKIEYKPSVLDLAFGCLQAMKFKKMPTNKEFYDRYTEDLREVLGLNDDRPDSKKDVKIVKMTKNGK